MNTQKNHRWMAGIVTALLCVPLGAMAQTESSVLHGRVSFDAGGTLLKGSDESDWSSGSINTLILPGDTVWVDNGGTTELEFSGGAFLRMADGSKAEIQSVSPGASVRAWVGSFYVHRLSRSSGSFVFSTPAGIIEVERDTAVRIDITDGDLTTVSTRWGRVTVRTDAGGSVQATAGKRVYIESGYLPSEPTSFDRTSGDPFDDWNRERSEFYATGSTSTPAAVAIGADVIGASDLDRYGEWVTIDSTPYWRPTVIVDYTPYHYGYWNNVHSIGSVWVGNYPFSYVTSHHGYWDYNRHYGWIWSYTPRWSPAWAATVRYGDYFVWAPVNRHFRPVYPHSSAHFSIGGVEFGFHGTSYVHYDHLYQGPRYVDYAYHDTFRHYYGRPNVTVNIWNINYNTPRPYVNVPYNNSVTTVRDYTPRRSIRGASTFQVSGRSATDRVQRLEGSNGRDTYSRATRTGGKFERTSESRSNVANRTRVARIDQSTPDFTRATRSNPVRATNDGPRRTDVDPRSDSTSIRGRETATRTPGRGDDSRTVTRTPSRGDNGNATTRTPSRGDDSRTVTRTPSRSDNGNATTRTPSRGDDSRTVTRTPSRSDNGNATTRTPSRSDNGNATTRTPSRSDSGNATTRTPSRSDNGNATTRTPSRGNSGNATTRTPSRSSATTSRTPSSSRTASTETTIPRQTATPTPTRSSAPSRSVAPRESAPSRYVAPRQSEPSRVVAPPQTQTPLYNSEPRSSGRTTTREVAPSRSSNSSNRSVSTPAPRQSTPRVSAPSRNSSSSSATRAPSSRGGSTPDRAPSNSRRR